MGQQTHARTDSDLSSVVIEVQGTGRLWRPGRAGSAALREAERASPGASVVGGAVAVFVAGLSEQDREDVLASTLFAQLAANAAHDREREPVAWYENYSSGLERLGWVRSTARPGRGPSSRVVRPRREARGRAVTAGDLRVKLPTPGQASPSDGRPGSRRPPFLQVGGSKTRFTAEEKVIESLRPSIGGPSLQLTRGALQRLSQLAPRDRRAVIFESNSHASSSGTFSVSVSTADAGLVRMVLVLVHFTTREPVSRVLAFRFSHLGTKMLLLRDEFQLDTVQYGAHRADVLNRLSDQASALIDDLEV